MSIVNWVWLITKELDVDFELKFYCRMVVRSISKAWVNRFRSRLVGVNNRSCVIESAGLELSQSLEDFVVCISSYEKQSVEVNKHFRFGSLIF